MDKFICRTKHDTEIKNPITCKLVPNIADDHHLDYEKEVYMIMWINEKSEIDGMIYTIRDVERLLQYGEWIKLN